jgi:hypothetical protein
VELYVQVRISVERKPLFRIGTISNENLAKVELEEYRESADLAMMTFCGDRYEHPDFLSDNMKKKLGKNWLTGLQSDELQAVYSKLRKVYEDAQAAQNEKPPPPAKKATFTGLETTTLKDLKKQIQLDQKQAGTQDQMSDDDLDDFTEDYQNKIIKEIIDLINTKLPVTRNPQKRAQLLIEKLVNQNDIRFFLDRSVEKKWQWNVKDQSVISHLLENLRFHLHEYKNTRSSTGREIYCLLLKLLVTPPQEKLQRATVRLFGLISRRGLRRAQTMMAEEEVQRQGTGVTEEDPFSGFSPDSDMNPDDVLSENVFCFVGLSQEDNQLVSNLSSLVLNVKEQIAQKVAAVEDRKAKLDSPSTIFSDQGRVEQHKFIETINTEVQDLYKQLEKHEFELSNAKQKALAANLQLAKQNQLRLQSNQAPFATADQCASAVLKPSKQEQKKDGSLDSKPKAARKDATPEELKKLIVSWWLTQTRITANVNDVQERNGKLYPTQWLEDTVANFYQKFLQTYNLFYPDQLLVRFVPKGTTPVDITKSIMAQFGDIVKCTSGGGRGFSYTTLKSSQAAATVLHAYGPDTGKPVLETKLKITHGEQHNAEVLLSRRAKVGITKFAELRPFFVKNVCSSTCVCVYCYQVKLLLSALLAYKHWDNVCPRISELIDTLKYNAVPFSPRPSDLLGIFLCSPDEDGEYSIECCRGDCDECGWDRHFGDLKVENNEVPEVKYSQYTSRTIEVPKKKQLDSDPDVMEKKKTRPVLETTLADPVQFLSELKSKLDFYFWHYAMAVHQNSAEKQVKQRVVDSYEDECICLDMDFSENHEIVHKVEIQSEHWGKQQVTLYIVISHHRERTDPQNAESPWKLVSEAHVFVSSDGSHDTYFVQHALEKLREVYKRKFDLLGKKVDRWYINTDGAPSHFKNRFTMFSLKILLTKSGAKTVMWSTCAPGHGKGPWDGIGAVVKRILRTLEKQGKAHDSTPMDVFLTLVTHFSTWRTSEHDISDRYSIASFNFYYIPCDRAEHQTILGSSGVNPELVLCPISRPQLDVTPDLKGIKKHYFDFIVESSRNTDPSDDKCSIQMREQSCVCDRCFDLSFENCLHGRKFQPVVNLKKKSKAGPLSTRAKTVQNRDAESRRRRALAKTLKRDQWAAIEDPDENPFWLAKVVEPAFEYAGLSERKDFVDFVKGHWYIKLHVYKPKESNAPGGVTFDWARNPHGGGVSSWTVDAESVFSVLSSAPVGHYERRSTRLNCGGMDAYESKQLDLSTFSRIKSEYTGKLAYL